MPIRILAPVALSLLVGCGGGQVGEEPSPESPTAPATTSSPSAGDAEAETLAACLTEGGYEAEVGDPTPTDLGHPDHSRKVSFRVEVDEGDPPLTSQIDLEVFSSPDEFAGRTMPEEWVGNVYLDAYARKVLDAPAGATARGVVDGCLGSA